MAEVKPINFKLEVDTSALVKQLEEVHKIIQQVSEALADLEDHISRVEDVKDSVIERALAVGINAAGEEFLDTARTFMKESAE